MKQTRDSIANIWGERTPYVGDWPVRVNERVSEEPDHWVQSACILCSNGCGMDIGVKDGRIVGVRGRAVDAVSHGRLGPKGLHGWVANNSEDCGLVQPTPLSQCQIYPVSAAS
jgi:anaerobic selenocysteine-containing dehydrogenase